MEVANRILLNIAADINTWWFALLLDTATHSAHETACHATGGTCGSSAQCMPVDYVSMAAVCMIFA
ncbi:hypothetical protein AMTR_s00017p00181470 [Amborella trichopoda]|uniref:Uncharacterized protein n=1 Tax=Amborella trichopoda TaxID=13333 RepID=W1PF61_AMBTC|nr:hypothetical protein AMTR_s00017p00181470 [Amborella trichopoda]